MVLTTGLCLAGISVAGAPSASAFPAVPVPSGTYFPAIDSATMTTGAATVLVGNEYWTNSGAGFTRRVVGSKTNVGAVGFDYNSYGLVVSPDHTTAYEAVPDAETIEAVTATDPAVATAIGVSVCNPRSLAQSGTKLFYGWGCAGGGGVGVIDLTTNTAGTTAVLPTPTTGSPLIALTADRMLVADTDGKVLSYAFNGTTVSGEPATVQANGTPVALSVSRDGSQVAVATTSTIVHTYDATTLSALKDFHLKAKPLEAIFSPDNTKLAITTTMAGLTAYAPALYVFNATTGATLVRAALWVKGYKYAPNQHTLWFTSDSQQVHVFGAHHLVTSIAYAPKAVTLKLALKATRKHGGTDHATVTTNVPGLAVTLDYRDGGYFTHHHAATTNSKGVAKFTWKDIGGGDVSANTVGDFTHSSRITGWTHYRFDGTIKVSFVGKHTKSGSVYRFVDEKHFVAQVKTDPGDMVTLITYGKHGSKWVAEDKLRFSTAQGRDPATITFHDAVKNRLYRFKVTLASDVYSRGATTTSPTFTFSH